MNNAKIISFGSYVPEKIVKNDDLVGFLNTSDEWITSRTGIRERRISTVENTSQLCAKAAQKIIESAKISPEEIDAIILATITPDSFIPSTACSVQSLIGAKNAFAFDITAACSGFVYALSTAEKFIKSGSYKNILVLGGETLSKSINWEDRTTAVLFGDGAGGVLLSGSEKKCFLAEDLHSDGTRSDALTYGYLPLKNAFTKEHENEEQNKTYLSMDGRATFDFVVRSVPMSIIEVLQKANVTFDDIKYIVPHQANLRIVESLAKKLKIDLSKFYTNIEYYGNTSAASIPIALSEMCEKGLIKPGNSDKLILTGFGGGLTWGSILLEI